jgi:DNA invertase Pin-like site-specific DNA recombinase
MVQETKKKYRETIPKIRKNPNKENCNGHLAQAKKKEKMKTAIYIRVSRQDLHPENQLIELKKFCDEKQYEIYEVYEDRISGIKESRPALGKMLKDATEKKFDVILIWKLDRLGRSLSHLVKLVRHLNNIGIDLICKTQNIDTTTSGGKLLFHIFCAIAEFERDLISERTKAGMERARSEGKQIGRKKGQKDTKQRKTDGYFRRYAKNNETEISYLN